jgi:hypothetical protein
MTSALFKFIHILNSRWKRPSNNPHKVAALSSVKNKLALDDMYITDNGIKYLCDNA